ncbi:hypothetical protein DJ62_3519 [Yersinia enterocolitica]|nr:hypothetical protein DJ62_3519 [Yersinia enterocolitica]
MRQQRHLLHVLRCCRKQALHLHFHQPTEPRITVAMMLFRVREAPFHRLLAPRVHLFAPFRQPQRIRLFFRLFPHVPRDSLLHLPVFSAFTPFRTSRTHGLI